MFELAPFALPAEYGDGIIPLADAKAQCRVLHDDEDDLIGLLRDAAIDMVERYCGVRLAPCEGLVWRADRLCSPVRLPVWPVSAITAISWLDSAGETVTGDPATLRLGLHGEVLPKPGQRWATGMAGGIAITFNAGFAEGEVPPSLIHAAKLFLAHLYNNREAVITGTISGEVPLGFAALCAQHRLMVI